MDPKQIQQMQAMMQNLGGGGGKGGMPNQLGMVKMMMAFSDRATFEKSIDNIDLV